MRILQVNKFLIRRGGVETYLLELGHLLEQAGDEVQYFGMDDDNKVVGNRWDIYAPRIDLGGRQRISRVTDIARLINSRVNANRFTQLLELYKPDVIHFNNIHYHLTPSVILAAYEYKRYAEKQVGLVMTMHDYHSIVPCDGCMNNSSYEICDECLDGHYWRCARKCCTRGGRAKSIVAAAEAEYWNKRQVYRCLDRVICPSSFMKEKFDRVPDFTGRTVHIPNFTVLERKSYMKERYILYFGAYNRDKGVATLLDVARHHPDIPFKFAGRGPLTPLMIGISNVDDMGYQTGNELHGLIGRAALVVVPSEWPENSPFVVLEALCCGTPVLGANIGGIPELVNDGVTGELFEFRDPVDLDEKLTALWEDSKRLKAYSRNCIGFSPMTSARYVQELHSVYSFAMDRSSGGNDDENI